MYSTNKKRTYNYNNSRRKMKTCFECGKIMQVKVSSLKEGIPYHYYSCSCGEEVLDMAQLDEVAKKYREYKRMKSKLSKWGSSLGVRIPKELVQKYKLKPKSEVTFIPEEDGIRMIT